MNSFTEISTRELSNNTFQFIGSDWMLVTAKKDELKCIIT